MSSSRPPAIESQSTSKLQRCGNHAESLHVFVSGYAVEYRLAVLVMKTLHNAQVGKVERVCLILAASFVLRHSEEK